MKHKILTRKACRKYGYDYPEEKAKQKIVLKLINAAESFGYSEKIADFAQDMDKEYFERHPGEVEYTRPVIVGEFPEPVSKIRVVQVMPGIRIRQGIYGRVENNVMPN